MKFKPIIAVFIVAFILGHFSNQKPTTYISNSDDSCNSVSDSNDTHFKSDKILCHDKLEEAKELYGKAFTLFLANLGIKLSGKDNQSLTLLIDSPEKYIEFPQQKKLFQKPIHKNKEPKDYAHYSSFIKDNKDFVDSVDDTELVLESLNNVFKDPALAFARSKHIKEFDEIKPMNGLYAGKLFLFAGKDKGETHDVEISIDYISRDGQEGKKLIDGSFALKLISEGEAYSNSRGSGGNGNIRAIEKSIIIEAGPNNFFSFKKDDLSTANFYSNGKHTGFLRLNKVSK